MAIQILFVVSKWLDNAKRTNFSEIVSEYESGGTRSHNFLYTSHRIAKRFWGVYVSASREECHPFIFCLPICVYLSESVSTRLNSHFVFVVANRDSSLWSASLDCSESLQSGVRSGNLWTTTLCIVSHLTLLIHWTTCCVWCIVTRLSPSTLHSRRCSVSNNTLSAWSTSHRNTWTLCKTLIVFQTARKCYENSYFWWTYAAFVPGLY